MAAGSERSDRGDDYYSSAGAGAGADGADVAGVVVGAGRDGSAALGDDDDAHGHDRAVDTDDVAEAESDETVTVPAADIRTTDDPGIVLSQAPYCRYSGEGIGSCSVDGNGGETKRATMTRAGIAAR